MEHQNVQRSMGSDVLRGADEIAEYLFGDVTARRRVYYLVETHQLPHFRIGKGRVFARRSTLAAWIATQEARRPTVPSTSDVGRCEDVYRCVDNEHIRENEQ